MTNSLSQPWSLWNKNHNHRKTKWDIRGVTPRSSKNIKPQKKNNKVEIHNLHKKEFRVMTVKMIQDLKNRMKAENEKIQEMSNKELEDLKNKQRSTLQELKRKIYYRNQWQVKWGRTDNRAGRHLVDILLQSRIKGKKGKRTRTVKETHGTLKAMFTFFSLVAQLVKNLPAMKETPVQFLGWEDPLENGKATHSSILAWRIP